MVADNRSFTLYRLQTFLVDDRKGLSMMAKFVVKQVKTSKNLKEIFPIRSASIGRRPGALDHEHFFLYDKTGFFIGELDGKVISCVSAVKHSKDYVYFGQYFVDEAHRGKGYGLATWNAAVAYLPDGCNCGAIASEYLLKAIYNRIGYSCHWKLKRFTIPASQALSGLVQELPKGITIKPALEVPFPKILEYDTSVHVYARPSFLEKWISAPNCFSYAAIDEKESVLGYAVVRTTLRQEDGWRIGPLFADNSQIAKSLYQAVFNQVIVSKHDQAGTVSIDAPHGDALQLVEEFGAPTLEEVTLMHINTKTIPSSLPPPKVFSMTSIEIGHL